MSGLLAEGTLYLNRTVNGSPAGWKKLPGVAKFSITNSAEIKEQKSKDLGQFGQVTASIALPKPAELAVTISDFNRESLAFGLMGDDAVYTASSGSVTDEAVTADLDVYVPLAHKHVTSGTVVVTNSAASTTYVENTDYEINYAFGMIKAITGGAITDAQSLKVDYTHAAASGFQINGSTKPQVLGALRLDGRNLADDKKIIVEVYSALLVSDAEIDFMADDFVQFSMSGRMNTPSGQTSPINVKYY
jgi:hypothetical protein